MININQNGCLPLLASLARAVTDACEGPMAQLPKTVKEILFEHANIDGILLPQQRLACPTGYARHLLHADPKGRFSIVAIVWSPHQQTPIHAHYIWCAYCVVAGVLQEERFSWDATRQQTTLTETVTRHCTETGYGHAGYEQIHRLSNIATQAAISIHVYGIDADRVSTHVNRLAI